MTQLPVPSPEAQAHSDHLAQLIRHEIVGAGGWISFARYMELALYAPGLGYYSAGAGKFGASGDFVTAPEISSLFGHCLARQVSQVLGATGGDVLEAGAGTGRLAAHLLAELERLGTLPERYRILEVSADLRARQQQTIVAAVPHLAARVEWLEMLPERFTGVIIGNEVLDAMPVHLVAWLDDGLYERGVGVQGEGFRWVEQPLIDQTLREAAQKLEVAPEYRSEINLAAPAFVATLAGSLERGVLLFVDYGFGSREYYHPQRDEGTLMCHYRHHAHDDPFYLPGLQDITAHVDFTAIAAAGAAAGIDFLGYTTQAQLLINCGITDVLMRVDPANAAAYLPLAAQAQKLMSPAEMGELFKAIAFGRGVDFPLLGFRSGDKRRLL